MSPCTVLLTDEISPLSPLRARSFLVKKMEAVFSNVSNFSSVKE